MSNLSVYLVESADMYPDGPALRCDGTTTTFSELADNAARFAAYLAERGLRPGDRVGVMSRGRLREIRPAVEWTEETVMACAVAVDRE